MEGGEVEGWSAQVGERLGWHRCRVKVAPVSLKTCGRMCRGGCVYTRKQSGTVKEREKMEEERRRRTACDSRQQVREKEREGRWGCGGERERERERERENSNWNTKT